jgi:hypothetical protein
MLTYKELDEIKARCDAATKGPWDMVVNDYIHDYDGPECYRIGGYEETVSDIYIRMDDYKALEDAEFVMYSREDVPALLETIYEYKQREICGVNGSLEIEQEIDELRNALKEQTNRADKYTRYYHDMVELHKKACMERDAAIKEKNRCASHMSALERAIKSLVLQESYHPSPCFACTHQSSKYPTYPNMANPSCIICKSTPKWARRIDLSACTTEEQSNFNFDEARFAKGGDSNNDLLEGDL